MGPANNVPREYLDKNVQPMNAVNRQDDEGNPSGGHVKGVGLEIEWQNGPRAVGHGHSGEALAESNGAFVEDAIYAALQRLEYFQDSKYENEHNAKAIDHLKAALDELDARRKDRAERGVEGKHEV